MKAPLSLSKAQRLRTPRDYRRIYQNNQWGSCTLYSYNVKPIVNQPIDQKLHELKHTNRLSALGVTVSKKVSKRAVVRNRIKRQIKEFYRVHQHELMVADLVITARANSATASDKERWQNLELLWDKILKWQRQHQLQQSSAGI